MTTIYFEKPYNPNKEYYFLDYHCSYETRWVRCPYKTWEEVTKIIQELNLEWGFDKESKGRVNFPTNVRITPERELAELRKVWNEEKQDYEDDTITEREYRFGGRYEVDSEWTGWENLTKKEEETLEEWKVRVSFVKRKLELEDKENRKKRRESINRIKEARRQPTGF